MSPPSDHNDRLALAFAGLGLGLELCGDLGKPHDWLLDNP